MSACYVLRTYDLAKLQKGREPSDSDLRTARRTLHLLWAEGYLYRLLHFDLRQQNGGAAYVYGLTDRGVAEYGGKSFDGHAIRTLDHELTITDFHIALTRWCAATARALSWQQVELKKGIHPDAYFSLSPGPLDFFLEVERQKFTAVKDGKPSIVRKAERYYAYYNTEQCYKDWGFKLFRVIFQVENPLRAERLLDALRPIAHLMFWIGIAGELQYRTPADRRIRSYSFSDI